MILSTKIVKRSKPIILLLLLLPSMLWGIMFVQGNLGINPIEKLMNELGKMALRLIIVTLIISSLSQYRFLLSLQNIRRMIGITAFYYVSCHFLTYIVLDHFFVFISYSIFYSFGLLCRNELTDALTSRCSYK